MGPICKALRILSMIVYALSITTARADDWFDESNEAIDAIWMVRSVTLNYHSPTTYFFCDTLRRRVAEILKSVGASDLMNVKANCSVGSLINHTQIRIVAGVPLEATPENVIAETTHDTRTRMIAKMHEWTLATPTSVHRFRAARREISFANAPNSDCDLLAAMSTQVFPALRIQPKRALQCVNSSPDGVLKVDALVAISD
jgi:hypothetical protein